MGVGNIKPWQKQCPQSLSVRERELQKAMNSSRTEVNWSNFSRHLGHLGISQVGKGIKIQNICEARSDYLCHGNCLFGAVVSSECDSTTVCSLTHRYSNYLVLRPWSSKPLSLNTFQVTVVQQLCVTQCDLGPFCPGHGTHLFQEYPYYHCTARLCLCAFSHHCYIGIDLDLNKPKGMPGLKLHAASPLSI